MAIARVGTDLETTLSGVPTQTANHTIDTGANFLLVRISQDGTGAHTQPSAVEWNGDALTKITGASTGTLRNVSLWYMVNPDIGTFDLIITTVGTTSNSRVIGVALSGVDLTAPITDSDAASALGATSATLTLTTATGEMLFDQLMLRTDRVDTVGANQTETDNTTFNTRGSTSSEQAGADGGVMSNSWAGGTSDYFYGAVSIAPAAAAGGTTLKDPILNSGVIPFSR